MPSLRRAPLTTRFFLVIGSIVLAASLAEAGLRAAHFQYHIYPTIQFGWPDATALRDVYRADPDLVWVTRDFDEKLAWRGAHPAIVLWATRAPSSDRILEDARTASTRRAGVRHRWKLGVGGWSSEQGDALRRDVLALRPR
jgi:hypothetical protein